MHLALVSETKAQGDFILRPYGKIGTLLTPPNTADLDYSVNGTPGGLDDIQEVSSLTYGFGFQVLGVLKNGTHIGGEIGLQNLFSSEISNPLQTGVYYNSDYDNEWEFYFSPLIEWNIKETPLFFQAGAGMHIVFWNWHSEFESVYSYDYDSDEGTDVNIGFTGTLGIKVKASPHVIIPLALRTDFMPRYGIMLQLGTIISVEFHP